MPEPEGYRGVHTVLGSPAGLKKFVAMHENPYHGLNFCQGTVSEMLKDPNKEIHDVIRYFGTRKKIFNVHFRNIHGRFSDFQETFPDVGSVNMIDAITDLSGSGLSVYADAGSRSDDSGRQGRGSGVCVRLRVYPGFDSDAGSEG